MCPSGKFFPCRRVLDKHTQELELPNLKLFSSLRERCICWWSCSMMLGSPQIRKNTGLEGLRVVSPTPLTSCRRTMTVQAATNTRDAAPAKVYFTPRVGGSRSRIAITHSRDCMQNFKLKGSGPKPFQLKPQQLLTVRSSILHSTLHHPRAFLSCPDSLQHPSSI